MSISYRTLAAIPTEPRVTDNQQDYIDKQCIHIDLIISALKAAVPKSSVKSSPYVDKNGKERVRFTISVRGKSDSAPRVYYMSPLSVSQRGSGVIYVNERSFDWFLTNLMETITPSYNDSFNDV